MQVIDGTIATWVSNADVDQQQFVSDLRVSRSRTAPTGAVMSIEYLMGFSTACTSGLLKYVKSSLVIGPLLSIGFASSSDADLSVYVKQGLALILFHVYDSIVISRHDSMVAVVVAPLHDRTGYGRPWTCH
jgi:hypothetical protein